MPSSGFGADAIAQRLNDGRAVAVITVDGSLRRGKPVGAKAVVDEALAQCPGVRHAVVLGHLETRDDWTQGRDYWWHELTAGAPHDVTAVPTEPMPADDPFLLMYTAGTSGKPKGVVHSHCGFPVKTALDLSIGMDLKPEDRFLGCRTRSCRRTRVLPEAFKPGKVLGSGAPTFKSAPNQIGLQPAPMLAFTLGMDAWII